MARTIGKIAKELGINVETIRFYERKGLIEQPPRPAHGHRHYPEEVANRIRFIKRAQDLGFTLSEIANLLTLNDSPCGQVQALARQKLSAVQDKISDLSRLENALNELLELCQKNRDADHCPIINALQPIS